MLCWGPIGPHLSHHFLPSPLFPSFFLSPIFLLSYLSSYLQPLFLTSNFNHYILITKIKKSGYTFPRSQIIKKYTHVPIVRNKRNPKPQFSKSESRRERKVRLGIIQIFSIQDAAVFDSIF